MELLKSIVVDFVLFSGIEGFIFCLFFEKIGGCRKFKWYEWLTLSFGNCVISQIFPPTIYQAIMIIWMIFILSVVKHIKFKQSVIQVTSSMLSFFLIEVFYSLILLYLIKFDGLQKLSTNESIQLFFLMIPLRFIEIICILIYTYLINIKSKGE